MVAVFMYEYCKFNIFRYYQINALINPRTVFKYNKCS